ncbi:PREDICTED: probable cytochrome c oxidase subunit 5C-1 isoform X1 [Brassica oleracea var. oleracea]|nr:PREDICTED: probable cytochrome c oxidase subunit 5C-1 isoform X1 [Brassica oleracea var. oleracea]
MMGRTKCEPNEPVGEFTRVDFFKSCPSYLPEESFHLFPSSSSSALRIRKKKEMAGHRVAHATLKGPSVVKELIIGLALGLATGGLWKMHHWNEQRKTRAFYDLLERGEINVIAAEE